jgi:hypothetical protein
MKKTILSIFAIALISGSVIAQAQIPNGNFEDWTGANPTGWGSSDAIITSLGQQDPGGVEKETTPANVFEGVNSMRVKTDSVTIALLGQSLLLPGIGSLGTLTLDFATQNLVQRGFPYTSRPDSIQFAYKYSSGNAGLDTGAVLIRLTNSGNEVGTAFVTVTNTNNFLITKAKIVYATMLAPDTLNVQVLSSASFSGGFQGSTMWADDLKLKGLDTAFQAYLRPSGDAQICQGEAFEFEADNLSGYTHRWFKDGILETGATSSTYTVTTGGTYTVEVTNGSQVKVSNPVTLVVTPLPTVTLSGNPDTVCSSAAVIALGGASPSNGTFSGTGVTGNDFNPATAGIGNKTITYTYADANGCENSATEVITVRVCASIENIAGNFNLSLYPNPAKDMFTVSSDDNLKGSEILVFDVLGNIVAKQLIESNITNVNAAALATGNYIFKIVNKNNTTLVNGKVAIQK